MNTNKNQILEAIVGLEWGDEGKGKIVDERVIFAQSQNNKKRTIVVRYQGGANAGHSVYVPSYEGLIKFVTHMAPSGLTNNSDIAIGPQVALNPIQLIREITEARKLFNYAGDIFISERTGILFSYHKKIDETRETNTKSTIGTTKQGIGPFYEDNARRKTRISFAEYISEKFYAKLEDVLEMKKKELEEVGINCRELAKEIIEEHSDVRKKLFQYSSRLEYRLYDYMNNGDNIIIEGAQGSGLDVDMGTIPDQTSSHLLAPYAFPSLGLSRKNFKIYGVEKVYPTRVGLGDFPTIANDKFGEKTVENAGEIGATTGRKRRVGYPDWVFVRRSARLNDCDGIYLTRVDNVQNVYLKVCIAYKMPTGEEIEEVPIFLQNVLPKYSDSTYSWSLWKGPENLSEPENVDLQLKDFREKYIREGFLSLPEGLKNFVRDHDKYVGVPTVGVSIGPSRGETVLI